MSIFNEAQKVKVKRNGFDLSHDKKLSCKIGQIIPVQCHEVLPGDSWSLNTSIMARFAPLIAVPMHNVYFTVEHFFVPNRLLWNGWEDFIRGVQPRAVNLPTEQAMEQQDVLPPNWGSNNWTNRTHPFFDVNISNVEMGTLLDYFGVPTKEDALNADGANVKVKINPLPLKAYDLIYDEYYRDMDISLARQFTPLVDGENQIPGGEANYLPHWRNYSKNYFTSARPWPQAGPEAMLPVSDGTVIWRGRPSGEQNWPKWRDTKDGQNAGSGAVSGEGNSISVGSTTQAGYDPVGTLWVDNSNSSITNLRRALALQTFLERSARFGNRYTEHVYGMFGVTSSDARLQRPEMIGATKAPIKFSEVLNHTGSTATDALPQGNMAGHGIGYGGQKKPASYFAEEHGWILSMMTIKVNDGYQQGIPKHMLKQDPFDYALPAFAHIGEQPIQNQEVCFDGSMTPEQQQATWGYTPRYAEYKHCLSTSHGEFRKNTGVGSLSPWHMNRIFTSFPALTDQFLQIGTQGQINRIFALNPDDANVPAPVWVMVANQTRAKRKLPFFGNPKIQ